MLFQVNLILFLLIFVIYKNGGDDKYSHMLFKNCDDLILDFRCNRSQTNQ